MESFFLMLMRSLFLGFALLLSPISSYAEDSVATCDEAKAMAIKGAAFLKTEGTEKAFAAFNDPKGAFRDRDLYVFVFDKDGIYKVHATKPIMVGKSVLSSKDITGYAFGAAIMAVKDAGWISYKYPDPANKDKIKDKNSYVIRVDNHVMGVGCYKN